MATLYPVKEEHLLLAKAGQLIVVPFDRHRHRGATLQAARRRQRF
jgi:hypothetical protein